MKNFKVYKSALAIFTSASILLLSGCGSSSNNSETKEKKEPVLCKHLVVYFEDKPITFKECEGYDISTTSYTYSSEREYSIYKEEELILSGSTTLYNSYNVYHDIADEMLESQSIQKVK